MLPVDGEPELFTNFPEIAKQYCEAIVSGRQIACRYVKLAAKRYLTMLRKSVDPECPYYFSPHHAVDFLNFWELCPVGDNWKAADYVEKEPFQIWIGCAIYGFRRRSNNTRWTNSVYLEIPRKHDKSGMAAIIGLYDMIFTTSKEPQILIGAASEDQAGHIFRRAALVVREEEEIRVDYKMRVTKDLVHCGTTFGSMQAIASVAQKQDGWNPSTMLIDELHAHANPGLMLVLKSAMGARSNQLVLQTTTAGRTAFGAGWDERQAAIRLLEAKESNERVFALIYTIDEEDKVGPDGKDNLTRLFTDETLWIKANPMYGVSVDPDEVRSFAAESRLSPAKREEFLRTRLNIWSNAASALIDPQAWADCEDKTLDISMMIGRKCWMGVDLSYYNDLTAIGLIFEDWKGRVPVFCKFFVCELSPVLSSPSLAATMIDWADRGFLTILPGGTIDTDVIADEIKAYYEVFQVQETAYDKAAGGSQMMRKLWDEGYLNLLDYPNRPSTMAAPTEDLLAQVNGRRIVHDGNECLRWNMLNTVGDHRANGTLLPKKDAPNSERKIDGFVALAMANAVRISADAGKSAKQDKKLVNPYAFRGVLGFEEQS
jgi:phage terminase large subunit-like protein